MNKSILITGLAGSGKSSICKELNKLGYKAHSIEDIKGLFKMIDKKTGKLFKNFDNNNLKSVKHSAWICDKKKLQQLIHKNSKGIVFYSGIASNLSNLLPLFDKIFLLKVSQKILRERLSKRTSNHFGRTSKVQKWMFRWKIWWEFYMFVKGAVFINANHSLREIAKEIISRA